ncbi:hypothetical protein GINT2_000269 [Glugoides intestinalis]
MHIEKTINRANDTVLYGRKNEKTAVIMIKNPSMSDAAIETIRNSEHSSNLENDVYRTASVECQLECSISVFYPEGSEKVPIIKHDYEYCKETYEEYLSSNPQQIDFPTLDDFIYEDEKIKIFSSELVWHCLFKDESIYSIRELSNLEELYALKEKIHLILEKNNRSLENTCLYFDYHGKLPCLLLNIVDISNGLSNVKAIGKFIYLDTLIKNLETAPDYYHGEMYFIKSKEVYFSAGLHQNN